MKKMTKVLLIVATIFAVIGVFCLIGSVAMGITWGTFTDMINDGKFSFGSVQIGVGDDGSRSRIEVQEEIRNLDIEIDAGYLEIYYDDEVSSVQIKKENVSGFKYYVDEDTLNIECERKWGIGDTDEKIIVVLPQGMNFREVDLEVGAGQAKVDGLITSAFDVSVGAGQADIKMLDVKELNAETGAGQLNVELLGAEKDYSYQLECGIGNISIAGQSYGGLGNEQNITNENAKGVLDIECGIGEVKVSFTE